MTDDFDVSENVELNLLRLNFFDFWHYFSIPDNDVFTEIIINLFIINNIEPLCDEHYECFCLTCLEIKLFIYV